MIKPAYSVSFLLSINIFVWQNVLYFLDAPRTNSIYVHSSLGNSDPGDAVMFRITRGGDRKQFRTLRLVAWVKGEQLANL